MIDSAIIAFRITEAERYLELIQEPIIDKWLVLRADAEARRDLALALALVFPNNWPCPGAREKIQGKRGFHTAVIRATRNCGASDYWGVPCTSNMLNDGAVADHAWPYGLGGPTVVGNIVWLCARHNTIKGIDIHFYPWEQGWPEWLTMYLDRLEGLIST